MSHAFEIESRDDHLWVWQRGCLANVDAARTLQKAVVDALDASGLRVAIFDNRETDATTDDVRQAMFDWSTDGIFDRVAIIVNGDMTAVRANMEALASDLPIKAFNDPDAARRWVICGVATR